MKLPKDTFYRFSAVLGIFDTILGESAECRFLDVGGYPGDFVRFAMARHPGWEGLTIDTPEEELPRYQAGSGVELPFEDGEFDVVVSMDTLEHIPTSDRERFLTELSRVSRRALILTAPGFHPATAECERLLNECHRELFGEDHPWLGEHVAFGLPKAEIVSAALSGNFSELRQLWDYDLGAWVSWQSLWLARKAIGQLDEDFDALNEIETDFSPTPSPLGYRMIFVGDKEGHLPFENQPTPKISGEDVISQCRMMLWLVAFAGKERKTGPENVKVKIEARLTEALRFAEEENERLKARPNFLKKIFRS